MGKKKESSAGLGRTIIRDRFGGPKQRKFVKDNSMLHTTEIQDGYDWGRLNLQSVTEESSFQEFLSTAELAGTEFQAEKLNIKFLNPRINIGLLSDAEMKAARENQEKVKDVVKIPRRPVWDSQTSAEELQMRERETFLEWRRSLAMLQEDQGLMLTPYEKNLEFWRQLWRVVEKSDVVVQIVDGRNPLLFRCEDLEKYVEEVSENKINMILINKADFLTDEQRKYWADYFTLLRIRVAFFSAKTAAENVDEESEEDIAKENSSEDDESHVKEITDTLKKAVEINDEAESLNKDIPFNTDKLYSREDLIQLFKVIHNGPKVTPHITTIGLVGYPNVGKSSTINTLMTVKKVSVSATPGKTKHFQTLFLEKELMLCDCPGLVMPSFVFTKAELVINGILPIDQMRDHVPPINLVSKLIPRHVIEDRYGIMLPKPMDGEDETRPPTSEELLNAYGYNRGFMTANGQPDNARSARYVLKDYINGKLLYAHAPPDVDQTVYHTWPERQREVSEKHVPTPREARVNKTGQVSAADLDKTFFQNQQQGVHVKGKLGKSAGLPNSGAAADQINTEKPWKKINKHENKKKREKLRRVYAHLDQH